MSIITRGTTGLHLIEKITSVTSYVKDDTFLSDGLTLKAVYKNGKESIIYPEQMELKYDFSSYGETTVSASYGGKTVDIPVSVNVIAITGDVTSY